MSSIIPGIIACGTRHATVITTNCDDHWDDAAFYLPLDGDLTDLSSNITATSWLGQFIADGPYPGTQSFNTNYSFASYQSYIGGTTDIGTGDCTIEMWTKWYAWGSSVPHYLLDFNATVLRFAYSITSPGGLNLNGTQLGSGALANDVWRWIVFQRESGVWSVWVDGTKLATTVADTTNITSFTIGKSGGYGPPSYSRFAEVRASKVARYSGATIPVPTGPFDLIQCGVCDSYWDDVVLLMHMDGTEGSSTFIDEMGNSPIAVGGAVIRNTPSMAGFSGSGSFYEGTTTGYVTVPATSDFNITTGDFTIEAWVYIDANSPNDSSGKKQATIVSYGQSSGDPTGWYFIITGDASTTGTGIAFNTVSSSGSPDNIVNCTVSISQDTWHHIAISRSGASIYIHLNGVGQTLVSNDLGGEVVSVPTANNLTIGVTPYSSYGWILQGYIDDLRITKGVARYTADFPVPTAPFGEDCYVPIPTFTSTGKVTIGPTPSTPPSYLPTPTPTPTTLLSTGAGGRMLEVIGGSGFHVMDNDLVKFDTTTLAVSTKVQNFGACDPTYTSGGVLIGCSNFDHSIHSTCSDGTNIYVSAYKELRKFDSSLNALFTTYPTVTYEHLCYASSFLWGIVGTNIYKINPTTLAVVSLFSIASSDGSLLLETDGTNLFVLRMVNSTTAELMKHTVASSTTTSLYSGLDRRSPIVVGNYVYVGSDKVHTSTGATTALSFDLNTSPYIANDANWSVSGALIAVLKFSNPATWKQEILIVDTSDDSIVDTITDFQEVISCVSGNIYAFCQGIGLLSSTKLIVSNGKTACYNYWGGLGYAGYSVYELT